MKTFPKATDFKKVKNPMITHGLRGYSVVAGLMGGTVQVAIVAPTKSNLKESVSWLGLHGIDATANQEVFICKSKATPTQAAS